MSREETIKWLKAIEEKYIHGGDEEFDAKRKEALFRAIKALEQKPKAGHWERETFDLGNDLPIRVAYQCSECGEYFDGEFKYCPNCGAKMVETQESEET